MHIDDARYLMQQRTEFTIMKLLYQYAVTMTNHVEYSDAVMEFYSLMVDQVNCATALVAETSMALNAPRDTLMEAAIARMVPTIQEFAELAEEARQG